MRTVFSMHHFARILFLTSLAFCCVARAQSPADARLHQDQGAAELMLGDCADAQPNLRAALKMNPSSIEAEGLLGICEKRMGEPEARQHLKHAFDHARDPKLKTEIGVELADYYYQRGDLDHTLPTVRALVALNPENVDILFFAQSVYQDMADNTLNKLALLAPDSPRMQQAIAEHLVSAGNLKDAATHYRKALAMDPNLPGAHFELGEAILDAAPQDATAQAQAAQEFEQALRVDGDSARIECELGREDALQSRLDSALAHYRRALRMVPGNVAALMGAARVLTNEQKPSQALPLLRQAVEADPLNAEAHYRYARALRMVHKPDEARKQMALYQVVRRSRQRVVALYRQMNRLVSTPADQPDPE